MGRSMLDTDFEQVNVYYQAQRHETFSLTTILLRLRNKRVH